MDREDIECYWGHTNNWEAYKDSYFSDDENTKPHKRSKWLVEILNKFEFESIFEIGSNCGRNLYHLKRSYPDVRVGGLDINRDAVEYCCSKVDGNFYIGSIYDIDSIVKDSYDIVFSMSTLCFVSPDKLADSLEAITNISRKHIFHFEHFGKGQEIHGESKSQDYWANDFESFYLSKAIYFEKFLIPADLKAPALEEYLRCDL